jgi:hypothetical protein
VKAVRLLLSVGESELAPTRDMSWNAMLRAFRCLCCGGDVLGTPCHHEAKI